MQQHGMFDIIRKSASGRVTRAKGGYRVDSNSHLLEVFDEGDIKCKGDKSSSHLKNGEAGAETDPPPKAIEPRQQIPTLLNAPRGSSKAAKVVLANEDDAATSSSAVPAADEVNKGPTIFMQDDDCVYDDLDSEDDQDDDLDL